MNLKRIWSCQLSEFQASLDLIALTSNLDFEASFPNLCTVDSREFHANLSQKVKAGCRLSMSRPCTCSDPRRFWDSCCPYQIVAWFGDGWGSWIFPQITKLIVFLQGDAFFGRKYLVLKNIWVWVNTGVQYDTIRYNMVQRTTELVIQYQTSHFGGLMILAKSNNYSNQQGLFIQQLHLQQAIMVGYVGSCPHTLCMSCTASAATAALGAKHLQLRLWIWCAGHTPGSRRLWRPCPSPSLDMRLWLLLHLHSWCLRTFQVKKYDHYDQWFLIL